MFEVFCEKIVDKYENVSASVLFDCERLSESMSYCKVAEKFSVSFLKKCKKTGKKFQQFGSIGREATDNGAVDCKNLERSSSKPNPRNT